MKLFNSDPVINDDGIQLSHHSVLLPTLAPEITQWWITVESWVSESYRLDGRAPVGRFRIIIPINAWDPSSGLDGARSAVMANDAFTNPIAID